MFELQDARFKTLAFGDRHHIFHVVKNEARDGRYRIVGPDVRMYYIRIQDRVFPDPDRTPLERRDSQRTSTQQYTS